jgi:hypothetical protein
VPFGFVVLVILWYHLAGHSPRVVADRRNRARWFVTKTHPSYQDMISKLRKELVAAQYGADPADDPIPEDIKAIRLAWTEAAA